MFAAHPLEVKPHTRDVLVSTERTRDVRTVRQDDGLQRCWGPKALYHGLRAVNDDTAVPSRVSPNDDLGFIKDLRVAKVPLDVGRRRWVEVDTTEVVSEKPLLALERSSEYAVPSLLRRVAVPRPVV